MGLAPRIQMVSTRYHPARTDAAMRRLYGLAAAGLATVSLMIWLATRML